MSKPQYELRGVERRFQGPAEEITILKPTDLTVEAGESLAIIGASGSGKTTFLHLLGTLDIPSGGTIAFEGRDLSTLSMEEKADFRNRDLGFVFQFHHLLPEFSSLENTAMPGLVAGMTRGKALERAHEALELVGLGAKAEQSVTTLSGGERQRVAIARAIFMKPKVLLADEPTGNLDEKTGRSINDLLTRLNRDLNMTLIVVTHNLELARGMGRQLELHDGELNG